MKLPMAQLSADTATLFNGLTKAISKAVSEAVPGLELKMTKSSQNNAIMYGLPDIKNKEQRKEIEEAIRTALAKFKNPSSLYSAMVSDGVLLRTKLIK